MADEVIDPADETVDPSAVRAEVENQLNSTNIFKPKTQYILIGDEPSGGPGVVDLKSMLAADAYDGLKKFLTLMPRQMLWDFFTRKVWPSLPWDANTPADPDDYFGKIKFADFTGRGVDLRYANSNADAIYGTQHQKKAFEDMVWAAFIDLFNEVNLAYVNQNQLDPWDWEQKKLDAYYVSQSKQAIEDLTKEIDEFRDVSLALDPKAKAIMEQYTLLPKLGDLGFEINRQNAIKELLKQRDYITAQAIVDAYRYAQDTVIGEQLTKPVPYDVVAEDGQMIARATEQ